MRRPRSGWVSGGWLSLVGAWACVACRSPAATVFDAGTPSDHGSLTRDDAGGALEALGDAQGAELSETSAQALADANPPPAASDADGGDATVAALASDAAVASHSHARCPREMVDVAGRICVDRFEASLIDAATGQRLSPHYPPEPEVALRIFDKWQEARLTTGSMRARAMPLPLLPEIERGATFRPKAVSVKNVIPQGYISGKVAAEACARAGKRLCTHDEWMFACRGEQQTKFPYGPEYRANVCNVFRAEHPAQKLHDDASAGHSDPRLGLVADHDGPLLRATGATKTCASRWGDDAIYDMVGNEDEWIDDPNGTFVGGFFSRSTREGCESIVTVHPLLHWDYSIGLRCCATPR
jgi:sulfatase modifying factor 1